MNDFSWEKGRECHFQKECKSFQGRKEREPQDDLQRFEVLSGLPNISQQSSPSPGEAVSYH